MVNIRKITKQKKASKLVNVKRTACLRGSSMHIMLTKLEFFRLM